VWPVFGRHAFTNTISPFLMFDYAKPKHFPPTKDQLGVGRHPHRGFETVTLALQGEIEHSDNKGHRDVIGEGDVQWMTAARGIVHDEFHSQKFRERGGTMEMCQLWVNLPKSHKMTDPRYQAILDASIPRVSFGEDAGYVRVIAGAHGGATGPAKTFSDVSLFHVVVTSDAEVEVHLDSPASHNALLFAARGSLAVADQTIHESQVALMERDGDVVSFKASPKAQIILMGGHPLDEPIANQGPFVMNTQAEIVEAVNDFYAGKF